MIVPLHRTYLSPFWSGAPTQKLSPIIAMFDTVPPGFIWTGSIMVSTSQILTAGANSKMPAGSESFNNLLQNMVFTFYRNGSAEFTWVGYSQPANVQLFSNDIGTVVGFLPTSETLAQLDTADPITVAVSFVGYAGEESEIELQVPFLSTSTQSPLTSAINEPVGQVQPAAVVDVLAPGTYHILTGVPVVAGLTPLAQLWSCSVSLGLAALTTVSCTAKIVDANGLVYAAVSLRTETGGTGQVGTAVAAVSDRELHGASVTAFPIDLVVGPTAGNVTGSAVLTYAFAASLIV